MNLTLICISFIVLWITLLYLPNVKMSKRHRHKSNASPLLICVKSIGQCSNTTRALGCASTELHSSIIAIAQIKFAPHKHADSTNFEISQNSRIFSRILKLSQEFSIHEWSLRQYSGRWNECMETCNNSSFMIHGQVLFNAFFEISLQFYNSNEKWNKDLCSLVKNFFVTWRLS